jgi:hypothetical protein
MKGRAALGMTCVSAALLVGCDALVGLTPPDSKTSPQEDGGNGKEDAGGADAGDDAAVGDTGAPGDGGALDAVVGHMPLADSPSPPPVPPQGTWMLKPDPIEAVAFAANAFYVLQTDHVSGTVGLGRMAPVGGVWSYPSRRWSGNSLDVSLAGLCTSGTSVYFGDSGPGRNEIRGIDAEMDAESDGGNPTTPSVVVDIASALPGATLGPVQALACDATTLAWIQIVGGVQVVLQHDLADPPSHVSALSVPPGAMGMIGSVAIDSAFIYVADISGTQPAGGGCMGVTPCLADTSGVLAFARAGNDGGSPLLVASSVAVATPIVAQNGGVFFSIAPAGELAFASPTFPGAVTMPLVAPVPLGAFVFDGVWLFAASGENIYYESTRYGGGAQTLVGTPDSSYNVLGLAAGGGYVVFYTSNILMIVPEPT